MTNRIINSVFYTCLVLIVAILAYYIMHNAQWLVGDDSMVICHTGFGHYVPLDYTVWPKAGRFFPLNYFYYNILWLFGLTSTNAHFGLQCFTFLVFALLTIAVVLNSIRSGEKSLWWYLIAFSGIMIIIQRAYNNFLDQYSTSWFDYTIITGWAICCYYVHTKMSRLAAVCGIILITYLCYCGESIFVFPLCYGFAGILLTWKKSSKTERYYYLSLIGTALVFLTLYFFLVFIHIDNAYDGAHGAGVGYIENAVKMFVAQKVLCLGLIVFIWRIYRILKHVDEFEFWDIMIISGFGFYIGGCILRLNWVLYYSYAAIFMIPAILFFLFHYLGEKKAAIVVTLLALFMCRTIPKYIRGNQSARLETTQFLNIQKELYKSGKTIYWFSPESNQEGDFKLVIRDWTRSSLQTLMSFNFGNENFKLKTVNQVSTKPGIYILPKQNEELCPGKNEEFIANGKELYSLISVKIVQIDK